MRGSLVNVHSTTQFWFGKEPIFRGKQTKSSYHTGMKVLIFGSKGYMGQEFLKLYPNAITPSVDIADCHAVSEHLYTYKPDVVINCAGKTGRPNVDWCEDHKLETIHSNVTGPLNLLEQCCKYGTYWVHIGSGCIYQGDNNGQGFSENDEPNFSGSFYSRSKAVIDTVLQDFPVLNIRLRMPFDGTLNERNFISKVSKYPRVLDTQNSLTYVPDFLKAVDTLIQKRATGTFNVVNPGGISPYRIMQLYKEVVDPTHEFERLLEEDLPEVAKTGRSSCILSIKKLEDAGVHMQPAEQAVLEALHQIKLVKDKAKQASEAVPSSL